MKPGETEPTRLEPIKLTDAERKKVQASAVNGLVRVLVAQAGMMLVAVVVSWAIAGFEAGASALLGALSRASVRLAYGVEGLCVAAYVRAAAVTWCEFKFHGPDTTVCQALFKKLTGKGSNGCSK